MAWGNLGIAKLLDAEGNQSDSMNFLKTQMKFLKDDGRNDVSDVTLSVYIHTGQAEKFERTRESETLYLPEYST